MRWTTLTLRVATPLFNGSADVGENPADEPGIRPASIRGAMRFWFRALAGSVIGPDLALLSAVESRIFGTTEHSSPLVLRIPAQPATVVPGGTRSFLHDRSVRSEDRRWLIYLMGQSLGDMKNTEILRPYVAPGQDFDLKLGFRHHDTDDASAKVAVETLAFASLWLMCAYGGVGARTRRGYGGIRITAAAGHLPVSWDTGRLLTPPLGHYEGLRCLWRDGPIDMCEASIVALTGRDRGSFHEWSGAPSFPVLSQNHAPARTGGRTYPTWQEALIDAGNLLRSFRADHDNTNPNARYEPKIETREWAEVIHRNSRRFQLGALGLPVVYKGGITVDAIKKPGTADHLRRASPLWLRPVGHGERWRLLSFAFNTQFLPEASGAAVYLSQGARRTALTVTDEDVLDLTGAWINAMAADDYPERPSTRA